MIPIRKGVMRPHFKFNQAEEIAPNTPIAETPAKVNPMKRASKPAESPILS